MKSVKNYISKKGIPSIEFLRDAIAYFDSRTECLNEGKTIEELLSEYVKVRKEFKVDKNQSLNNPS